MDADFNIKTDVFEGPLDVLLRLIEKRKLFINDVSLAAVTDDYITYVNSEGMLTIPHAAHFVYVASTLLLIKSKSLLPALTLTEEETGDIEDLEARLKMYQLFKQLAPLLADRYMLTPSYSREEKRQIIPVFAPVASLTLRRVKELITTVLSELPEVKELPEAVVDTVISLENVIENLAARITRTISMSFKDFTGNTRGVERGDRINVIVSFLALLELMKRGVVDAKQEQHFEDITIASESVSMPRYQ